MSENVERWINVYCDSSKCGTKQVLGRLVTRIRIENQGMQAVKPSVNPCFIRRTSKNRLRGRLNPVTDGAGDSFGPYLAMRSGDEGECFYDSVEVVCGRCKRTYTLRVSSYAELILGLLDEGATRISVSALVV